MSRYVQVVVLCEDRQQEVLARHFLVGCGVDRGRIRFKTLPAGKGAAEQHVRCEYPREVRAYRSRATYQQIGLVVVVDADLKTVAERLADLERELTDNGQDERQAGERIAVFVPKRNVETWIHFLAGETVDEVTLYSKLSRESDCRPFVQELVAKPAYTLTDAVPSALQLACVELQRLFPDKQCLPAGDS